MKRVHQKVEGKLILNLVNMDNIERIISTENGSIIKFVSGESIEVTEKVYDIITQPA